MASLARRFAALVLRHDHDGVRRPRRRCLPHDHGRHAGSRTHRRLYALASTHRPSHDQQHGPALMPSWMMTMTDPMGDSWYRGQVSLGAEMVYLEFREPLLTHGIGFTPRIKYTFVALGRAPPVRGIRRRAVLDRSWGTDSRTSQRIQFHADGRRGCVVVHHAATRLQRGYRFHHISNAGTAFPNLGLNASLPFAGFSFFF